MPRTYTKRPKQQVPCGCGCGRLAIGRAGVMYATPACRKRANRNKQRATKGPGQ